MPSPQGKDLAELIARRKRAEKETARRKDQEAGQLESLREILATLPGKDWWADCHLRHNLTCNGKRGHLLRCRDEATRTDRR